MPNRARRPLLGFRRCALRPRTLRSRLILALLLLFVICLAVVGTANVLLLRQSLLDRVDQQLTLTSQPWVDGVVPDRAPDISYRQGVPTDFRVTVLEPTGHVDYVLGQPPGRTDGPVLPGIAVLTAASGNLPFTVADRDGDSEWRVLVVVAPDGRYIAIALSLANTDAALDRLIAIESAAGAVILVLLGLVTTQVVRLGLRPLTRIEHTADAIARGELDRRLSDTDTRTETGRLGAALNTMLGRIASAMREREQSQQRLRRFVADASHELRTPLTSIRGFAELYRRGGAPDPSDVDRLMARIEGEATRMGRLVDDLLLLARLDEERPLNLADVDLLVLAADAVHDARAQEPDRSVTLSTPNGPQHVLGDEYRLRAMVANLVRNAMVHTPSGTPVRVTVDHRDRAPTRPVPVAAAGAPLADHPVVMLEVSDAGPGVSSDQAPKLFDRFYRAGEAHAERRSGTGLGLAITAAIVEAHRGRIELHSSPGAGARFRVLLPVG